MYIIIANKVIKKWLEENLSKHRVETDAKYVDRLYEHPKFTIKLYSTNTLTIEGEYKARIYDKMLDICMESYYIGADEVGVGDFFGPTVYCAVMMSEQTMNILKKLKVPIKDSKKLKDDEIKKIYNSLKDKITFEKQIVYDKDIKALNSIEQKITYHNKNYDNLLEKFGEVKINKLVIDLFTTEKNFHKRSKELDVEWPSDIILETKADSKYICVAIASIMARGIFLEQIYEISKKFDVEIPLGTNDKAVKVGKYIIEKYSKEQLGQVCKISFKTFKEI